MDPKIIFITILGMAVVTYLPRLLPVWLLSFAPAACPGHPLAALRARGGTVSYAVPLAADPAGQA